jgi:hypothetical protein
VKNTILYLCHQSPTKFSEDLSRAGFDVYDCLSGSEVLHLLSQPTVVAVVVAHGIENRDLPEIRQRIATVQLGPDPTSSELIWELSHFRQGSGSVH